VDGGVRPLLSFAAIPASAASGDLDSGKEVQMPVEYCIPVIPSEDLHRSLRLWVDGLEFTIDSQMHKEGKLINCMLKKDPLYFMLNQRAGNPAAPKDFDGIRLYWTPKDINETRERLARLGFGVSELEEREYGQSEFFLTDDDGFSHCFGVDTKSLKARTEPQ
jgi:hypothetical protein